MKHLRLVCVPDGSGRLRIVRLKPVWRAIRLQLLAARNPYFVDRLLASTQFAAHASRDAIQELDA